MRTVSLIGDLVVGNRFYFCSDKTKKVYQVTNLPKGYISYNIICYITQKKSWLHDKNAVFFKEVIFLR